MNTSSDQVLDTWWTRLAAGDPALHAHLIGIGGAGLSAIATVLLELGIRVSGSDRQQNHNTQRLLHAGAQIFSGQSASNLDAIAPDVVLISSAVAPDNPERAAAEARALPVVKRSEFLPALLAERKLIAVAGAHGKSTTTSMVVKLLRENGINTGYIIGTELDGYGNAAAGDGDYFVLEADEYDHMFLGLRPDVAIITNVEWDHPDCYPTPASFREAFVQFSNAVHPDGLIVSCSDDAGAEEIRLRHAGNGTEWLTYGLDEIADLRAINLHPRAQSGYRADLTWWNAPAGSLSLRVPGVHNVRNAMAALLAGRSCGVSLTDGAVTLAAFMGTARRFERKGEVGGVIVIDDYAHHPTEVEMTLAAARHHFPSQRIWAVFQPHTFSRTRCMLYRMGDSFEHADRVIVTDIYAAREQDDGSVSAQELVAASEHPAIEYIGDLDAVAHHLAAQVGPGDVVLTLGAGDGNRVGDLLLQALAAQSQ